MPDANQLLLFILAGWLLNLTPGSDLPCIVTHSLRSGVRAAAVMLIGFGRSLALADHSTRSSTGG